MPHCHGRLTVCLKHAALPIVRGHSDLVRARLHHNFHAANSSLVIADSMALLLTRLETQVAVLVLTHCHHAGNPAARSLPERQALG